MKDAATRRWTNVDKRRYYQATVQPDLFGGWVVMRCWGQLGSRLGGQLFEPVADPYAGELALHRIAKIRERRGYRPALCAPAASCAKSPEEGAAATSAALVSHG